MSENANVDVEAIRGRAHALSLSPEAGTAEENWLRAEKELRHPYADEDAVRLGDADMTRGAETAALLLEQASALTHP